MTQPIKRTMVAMRVIFFFLFFSVLVYTPRIPDIKDHLHISLATLGQIFMFTGLFGFFTAKIIAKIILKLSSRRAILVAVPFTMGGGTLIALAQNSFIFIIGLISLGFGSFLIHTAVNTQANTLRERTGTNQLANLSAITNTGALVAILVGSILLKALTTASYIIGVQILTSTVFLIAHFYLLPDDLVVEGDKVFQSKMPWFGKDLKQFWIIVLALFASTTAEFSVSDWGAILSRDDYKVKAPFYLLPFIFFQAGIVVSRFSTNALSKRFGEVRYVRYSAIGASIIWGIAIESEAHMSHANQALIISILVLSFFVAGCGVGPVWPTMLSQSTRTKYPVSLVLSRLFSITSLSFVFGPGLVASLSKITSLPNALMVPITSLFVVGLLSTKALARTE